MKTQPHTQPECPDVQVGSPSPLGAQETHPGTYRGLIEKISYLKKLGVTAVELMPVQEFNEASAKGRNPQTNQELKNDWGYDPVILRAPKASYSSSEDLGTQTREFKEMVRAFHQAGIEVILDVVLNHTAEGDEQGPTLCFRGMDNAVFYTLANDKRHYKDYTGTGNAINANKEPDWSDSKAKELGCLIPEDEEHALYLMFNSSADAVDFHLPAAPPGTCWHQAVDTGGETPRDIFPVGEEPLLNDSEACRLGPNSSAILLARPRNGLNRQTSWKGDE